MKDYYERVVIDSRQNLKDKDFWLKKLSGDLRKSYFPYDFKEISEKEMNYDKVELKIHRELEEKLISASKGSDQALHMILLRPCIGRIRIGALKIKQTLCISLRTIPEKILQWFPENDSLAAGCRCMSIIISPFFLNSYIITYIT